MMASPTAVQKYGADYFTHPVGTGPYKFVDWVKNDHTSLAKNTDYWNKDAVLLDNLTFKVIPDTTVRLTALKTGQVDMIDEINPKDITATKADNSLVYQSV